MGRRRVGGEYRVQTSRRGGGPRCIEAEERCTHGRQAACHTMRFRVIFKMAGSHAWRRKTGSYVPIFLIQCEAAVHIRTSSHMTQLQD